MRSEINLLVRNDNCQFSFFNMVSSKLCSTFKKLIKEFDDSLIIFSYSHGCGKCDLDESLRENVPWLSLPEL